MVAMGGVLSSWTLSYFNSSEGTAISQWHLGGPCTWAVVALVLLGNYG